MNFENFFLKYTISSLYQSMWQFPSKWTNNENSDNCLHWKPKSMVSVRQQMSKDFKKLTKLLESRWWSSPSTFQVPIFKSLPSATLMGHWPLSCLQLLRAALIPVMRQSCWRGGSLKFSLPPLCADWESPCAHVGVPLPPKCCPDTRPGCLGGCVEQPPLPPHLPLALCLATVE